MNVRQNLILTFSKKKKKKNFKFFEICFLSFRPYVTFTAGSRVRGNLSRFILPVPAEISHQIPTIPIQCTSCFFSLFFFLSLSPSFSCSRAVVNFEEHRIKLLMFSSFRNAPESFFKPLFGYLVVFYGCRMHLLTRGQWIIGTNP